jgi:hypothetical protein
MADIADGLSIGATQRVAQDRRTTYQRVLGFNMFLHLVIGGGCMFTPHLVSTSFGLPGPIPGGWIAGWGATLILVTALYIPGLQDPLRSRFPNIMGFIGRIWMASVWFVIGGGFFWFGVFDFSFAILLSWLFYRFCVAELMSRP